MDRPQWSALNVLFGIGGLVGAFLLYWGMRSLMDPSYIPSITIPWLDQTLRAIGQHVWIPAVGVLLLIIGTSPVIIFSTQRSRVARGALCSIGIILLCLGGMFVSVTLNPLFGFLFVSPLILTGTVLIAVALDLHDRALRRILPS